MEINNLLFDNACKIELRTYSIQVYWTTFFLKDTAEVLKKESPSSTAATM